MRFGDNKRGEMVEILIRKIAFCEWIAGVCVLMAGPKLSLSLLELILTNMGLFLILMYLGDIIEKC
jgi:hypothetical protein